MFPPVAMSSTLATFGFLFLLVSSAAAQVRCCRSVPWDAREPLRPKPSVTDRIPLVCARRLPSHRVLFNALRRLRALLLKRRRSVQFWGACVVRSRLHQHRVPGSRQGSSTKSVSASASTPAETSSTLTTITSNPSSSPTPPPFSFPSSDIPSSSAPSGSSASTTTIPSAPSTSPSTAAARGNGDGNGAHVAGVAGAVIGLAMWVL
ncbi:hypothetical protein C8R44DRAFT_55289 [Mycena epipterygia]|nr:hypothetical protein C8R44DRAFT_55289 [Mycena epipterygia]